jgi:phosphoglycolate phosphatase
MVKLVAFDWNGTIIADTQICLNIENIILKEYNKKPLTLKRYQEIFDVPITKMYRDLGFSKGIYLGKKEELAEAFHTRYEPLINNCRTRANTKQLLIWLHKNQIRSIILSNHTTVRINEQLKRLKLEKYFQEVLANDHKGIVYSERNKAHKLKLYMEENKLLPKEVLLIGDTIEEIEISQDVGGAISVALTGGYCSTKRLKAAKPDFLINNLKRVVDIIEDH